MQKFLVNAAKLIVYTSALAIVILLAIFYCTVEL